jgi:hypothetical protein
MNLEKLLVISVAVIMLFVIINILCKTSKYNLESYVDNKDPVVSLMHWNAHWQCFKKGNNCCSDVAKKYVNSNLLSRNVDFANIIEMSDSTYEPPSGYKIILNHCGGSGPIKGGDLLTLIYNTSKWKPISKTNKFCIEGRPTLIQEFQNNYNSFKTYVIVAHFSHTRSTYVAAILKAVKSLGITSTDNIIFMADTNQKGSNETLIKDMIGGTPKKILGSNLMGTCCFSGRKKENYSELYSENLSKFSLPYDRIITTFGDKIVSEFPKFGKIIPSIQNGCDYSEMHLPVFSVIS